MFPAHCRIDSIYPGSCNAESDINKPNTIFSACGRIDYLMIPFALHFCAFGGPKIPHLDGLRCMKL